MLTKKIRRWLAKIKKSAVWIRKRRYVIGIIWLVLGILVFLGLLLAILGPLAWQIGGGPIRHLRGIDQANALNAVRQTILTALGGTAALVAIGFTVRTYYLSRRGQVTDRFNKAITQLASDKLEERLGGIYALEHVMAESPADHSAVVGVLCAFVRTRTLLPPADPKMFRTRQEPADQNRPPFGTELLPDIDAAMITIARRPSRKEPNRPDLRRTCLVGVSLRIYDFEKPPRLTRMFLTGADLRRADLRGADLKGTIAHAADFRWALLSKANLSHTDLTRTQLREASLDDADLTGTQLRDADLRGVDGLTAQQLSHAMIDEDTLLPSELAEDPWVQARLADCATIGRRPWACPPPTPEPTNTGKSAGRSTTTNHG